MFNQEKTKYMKTGNTQQETGEQLKVRIINGGVMFGII